MRGLWRLLNRPLPLLWITLAACAYGGWHAWTIRTIHRAPGVLAGADPSQTELYADAAPFVSGNFDIIPLAQFELKARVLSRADYRLDALSKLIPTDLALGWGRMSDTAVLKTIEVDQGGRYYFWHTDDFPIPRAEIETHSANMHLIPANAAVARALRRVRVGNIVGLSGKLVEVRARAGWSIRSSLTRDDTGPGACEVVWVELLDLQ